MIKCYVDGEVERKRKTLITSLIENDFEKVLEVYDDDHVYLTPDDSVDIYIEVSSIVLRYPQYSEVYL